MTVSATHKAVIDAAVSVIAGLSLDGMESENIKAVWFPAADKLKEAGQIGNLPCVLVSPYGTEDMSSGGTNLEDDYGYPVVVSIVAATSGDMIAHQDKYLYWRELCMKAFHNKRLSGVTDAWRCVVRPGSIADFATFASSAYFASFFTVTVFVRKVRT